MDDDDDDDDDGDIGGCVMIESEKAPSSSSSEVVAPFSFLSHIPISSNSSSGGARKLLAALPPLGPLFPPHRSHVRCFVSSTGCTARPRREEQRQGGLVEVGMDVRVLVGGPFFVDLDEDAGDARTSMFVVMVFWAVGDDVLSSHQGCLSRGTGRG